MKYLVTFMLSAGLLVASGCGSSAPEPSAPATTKAAPKPAAELVKVDTVVGADFKGNAKDWTAAPGDLILMQYTGKLDDGTQFDSNADPQAQPFAFVLGGNQVIKGWDLGIEGMRKGGERKLTIPPDLGYGDQPNGKIPANSTLHFEVKMLDIVKKGQEGVYDKVDLKTGTGPAAKQGDTVTVHYVGKLVNGKQFDASRPRGEPFNVTLGQGGVIAGWDAGLVGVRKGTVRRLRIPPALGYGDDGAGQDIGPRQVLIFEIEVLSIKPGG